jgi:hypothetical protein
VISDFKNIPQLPTIMGPARQVAYMVDDIDAAMTVWHGRYGVGPFLVTRDAIPLTNAYYRGEKAQTTISTPRITGHWTMGMTLSSIPGSTVWPACPTWSTRRAG